jgi:excinuclease UvrABC nuclease subunit
LSRYYSENEIPKEIITEEKLSTSFVNFLSKERGSKISIIRPKQGEKKELLTLQRKI